jgi:toxin HigB-1
MRIRNIVHKGLRRLVEDDDRSGIQPEMVEKLGRMVAFLQDMQDENQLHQVPLWKAHLLTGIAKERGAFSFQKTGGSRFELRKLKLKSSI